MSFRSAFSSQLLNSRTKLGLTQAEAAESLGISVRWYQKLEKGSVLPGKELMIRLLIVLEIDPKTLREEVGLHEPVTVYSR